MKAPLGVIILANVAPLAIGVTYFESAVRPLTSDYKIFTLCFWSLATVLITLLCRRSAQRVSAWIAEDMSPPVMANGFVFLSYFLFIANLGWVLDSRSIGMNNTDIIFKSFFLFEDVLFAAAALALYRAVTQSSLRTVAAAAPLLVLMSLVFGRFAVFGLFILLAIMLKACGVQNRWKLVLVGSLSILGAAAIEYTRAGDQSEDLISARMADRVGEVATLGVVDQIFDGDWQEGFSGFDKLAYLYIPSVIFPDKPAINDGTTILSEEFELGAGENGTRFPILLHVDAFRRFGWIGLGVALLPALLINIMTAVCGAARSRFVTPFLPLVLIKYVMYVYPKSILGALEVGLYTFPRSALLFIIVVLILSLFGRQREGMGRTHGNLST